MTEHNEISGALEAAEKAKGIKVIVGEAAPSAPIAPAASSPPAGTDAASRALENPEVQRFREIFGGEVRTVRNLKE